MLPFGLRSAPTIFSAEADALQWMIKQRNDHHVFHYIDDFITVGKPGSLECSNKLKAMNDTCFDTGIPIEEDKCEGPATILPFIGIELDTV